MPGFIKDDRVAVVDDTLEGTVVAVKGNSVVVETQDGFSMVFEASQLVKIGSGITVSNHEAARIKKETLAKKKRPAVKPKDRNAPKMEVDLHIHQLAASTKGMSNFDMLTLQLDAAKRQLEFAMRKHIQKVVFIHGVGEGVLKEELGYLFRRYDNLKFYDADYQKYGMGATEVYIFQNP